MRFLNLKNWEDLLNIEHFFMTSLPVKMTSYQKKAWSINRFWVELSSPKICLMIPLSQPTQHGLTDPLLSNFQLRKKQRCRSQIDEQVTVLNQVEYGESDEHISFLIFWCLVFLRTKDFLYHYIIKGVRKREHSCFFMFEFVYFISIY